MATKVQRYWFVIPGDITGNGQTWYGPGQQNAAIGFDEPAQGRPRAGRNAPPPVEDETPAQADGYGVYLATKEQKEILAFTTKAKAEEYAKHQATMNPKRLFGIFACEQLFETTEPTVIMKKFNDAGELILGDLGA